MIRPHLPKSLDLRFSAAEEFFRGKLSLTREEFDRVAEEVRVFSFTVAHVSSMQLLEDFQDEIERMIVDGTEMEAFRKNVLPSLMSRNGWTGTTPWHIETILRTNVQMAYGVGHLETHVKMAAEFPFWRYVAINDSRVRPSHYALHGRIYPANHPFWRTHYPPWDYNCRCDVIALTAEQVGDEQVHTDDGPESAFSSPGVIMDLLQSGATPAQIAERLTMTMRSMNRSQLIEMLSSGTPLVER